MATFRRSRYRKVYRKRSSAPYKKRSYRKRSYKPGSLKRMVKKIVASNIENKTDQFFSPNSNIYVSTSSSFVSSIIPCSPYGGILDIQQGTGQGQRVGNQIKIKNLTLKGTISPAEYNATTNIVPQPIQVILWFFYSRDTPDLKPTSLPGWFQDGDSARNFQNDLTDVWSTVNSDLYRLLTKRVFKIGYSNYQTATGGIVPNSMSFTNNDFKLNKNFKINLTKYAIKKVRYYDTQGVPRSRGVFCLPQVVAASGGNIPSSQILARMSYQLDIQYEDA